MSRTSIAWPLLGHLPAFRADSSGFLLRIAREQGDVARFRLGRREAVLFSHPDAVTSVLVENARQFTKGKLMQRARRLLGDGLLTSEGEAHRSQRRRILPAFSRDRVESYAAAVPSIIDGHSVRWSTGRQFALGAEMDALAMSVVARTLFGTDILEETPQLIAALHTIARWAPMLALPGGAWLERSRIPPMHGVRKSIGVIEGAIATMIANGGARSPLIAGLLACPHGGAPMSERLVRDEIMTILLAGHDTTAAALSWSWLLLNAHPRVDARLQREIAGVAGCKDVLAADPASLPYTQMIVNEVLRLYPPIGRIGRRPVENVEVSGVRIPAGAPVFVSPFVTHRDPRWFEQPEAFVPERWAVPAARPRFAFFPFGAGPRACIGEHFARQTLVLAIASIARRWRLSGHSEIPRPRSLLTVKPRGCPHLQLERRR